VGPTGSDAALVVASPSGPFSFRRDEEEYIAYEGVMRTGRPVSPGRANTGSHTEARANSPRRCSPEVIHQTHAGREAGQGQIAEEVKRLLEEATEIFRGLDLNEDNQVTLPEWMAAFDAMDPNKSRTITRKEWCKQMGSTEMFDALFKQYSVRLTRLEWKQGFDVIDTDNDKKISLNEWSHKALERAFMVNTVTASAKAEEDTGKWLDRRQKEMDRRQNSGELMRKRMQPKSGFPNSPRGASPPSSPRASIVSPRMAAAIPSPQQVPSQTVREASPLCSSSDESDGMIWSRPIAPSGGNGNAPMSPRGVGRLNLAAVTRVKSNGLEMRPQADAQREAAAKHREAVIAYEAEIASLKRELGQAREQAAEAKGLREELAKVRVELQQKNQQIVEFATKFMEMNLAASQPPRGRIDEVASLDAAPATTAGQRSSPSPSRDQDLEKPKLEGDREVRRADSQFDGDSY